MYPGDDVISDSGVSVGVIVGVYVGLGVSDGVMVSVGGSSVHVAGRTTFVPVGVGVLVGGENIDKGAQLVGRSKIAAITRKDLWIYIMLGYDLLSLFTIISLESLFCSNVLVNSLSEF